MVEAESRSKPSRARRDEDPEEVKQPPSRDQFENNGVAATRDDELIINTSEQIEIVNSFDQLGISEQLLRGKCD